MFETFLALFNFGKKVSNQTIIDPSDIKYEPVIQSLLNPRKYVKQQPMRTTYPPTKASFNEVFSNVHNELNKR